MGYGKIIDKGTFEHRFCQAMGFPPVSDDDEVPLVLRITLDDMNLLDGFYMSLPASAGKLSIEDAMRKHVICENAEDRIKVRQKLARDRNPDLLDIYDALLYLYEQAEAGELAVSYHINNGDSDVKRTDSVHLHQHNCATDDELARLYNLLDLVLEVKYNLDPFSGMTDEQRDAMLRDFRHTFVLYLMDKFDYQPDLQDSSGMEFQSSALSLFPLDHLSPVLEYLSSEDMGLICFDEKYSITSRGYNLLSSMIEEAEFYIDNYDIFGDVYVNGAGEISFNTGYGENLVVPVFVREGIDPYRSIFMVALYLGNMDYLTSDPGLLFSGSPFEELFTLIPRSPTAEDLGTELLDMIISVGKSKVQEQRLREARVRRIRDIEQRITSI